MKRIDYQFRAVYKPFIVFAVTLLSGAIIAPITLPASTRPKTGGTLRVLMNEHIATIDPRQWPSDSALGAAAELVDSLIFDRLVRFDDRGTPKPALAVSWQHDAQTKRWQFLLLKGVKFSDGSPLTP